MIEIVHQRIPPPKFIVSKAPSVDSNQAYAKYIESGGQLDLKSFQFIMEFTPSAEIDTLLSQKPYQASNSQVASLAKHTGVDPSKREKQLYALLRIQLLTGDFLKITGKRPQSMSDQCLMAEILLLTSPEKMDVFTSKYPNIFPE